MHGTTIEVAMISFIFISDCKIWFIVIELITPTTIPIMIDIIKNTYFDNTISFLFIFIVSAYLSHFAYSSYDIVVITCMLNIKVIIVPTKVPFFKKIPYAIKNISTKINCFI